MSDIKIRELMKWIELVDGISASFQIDCGIMRNKLIMSLVAEQTNKFKEELFAVALHPDRILQWMDEVDEIWRK